MDEEFELFLAYVCVALVLQGILFFHLHLTHQTLR